MFVSQMQQEPEKNFSVLLNVMYLIYGLTPL